MLRCCRRDRARFFDSMVVKLSLHLLAVVMDINTIFTMVSSQRYILSLVLTTIVTQIFVKEAWQFHRRINRT